MSFLCLPASIVSDEKSAINQLLFSSMPWVIILLLLSRFSLSFAFSGLMVICLHVYLFVFISFGFLENFASNIIISFIKSGKSPAVISLSNFTYLFFSLCSVTTITNISVHVYLSHSFLRFFQFYSNFFTFCFFGLDYFFWYFCFSGKFTK